MAKVNVEYDTVAKTANVTIDGQQMKNLANLMVYCDYMGEDDDEPKFCLEMASVEYDKENDMRRVNRVCANKQEPSLHDQIRMRLFSSAYPKKAK